MEDFEAVYREYFPAVYRYLLSLCGEDTLEEELAQETFFRALRRIGGFRGDCSLRVWLCQIAKNLYYSHRRREARRPEPVPEPSAEGPEPQILRQEAAREAYRAVHRLEEPYKEVFLLRQFAGLPFREIAELFGKTESWARVTYHRARMKCREECL